MSAKAEFPPNWNDVETKTQQVENVRPAAIQGVADQFRQASKDSADHTVALRNATSVLGGGTWSGPQADAFFDYVKKIGDAGRKVNDHLDEVATELGTLQGFLDRTQKEVQQLRDDAHGKIEGLNQQAQAAADAAQAQIDAVNAQKNGATMPAQTPQAIIAQNTQATAAIATDTTTQVGSKLDAANLEIQRVMGLVQKDVEGGYASVPSLGTKPQSMKSTGGLSSGGGGGSQSGGGGGGGMGSSGGPPTGQPPGNVQQWIEQAIKELQAAGVNVTEADIKNIWAIIEKESGGNPNAINLWDCVPLDTAILTQRGWLKHDEVAVGDQTIGFNPETGRSEWTRISRVVHHADAPLTRLHNSRWQARTTPNHKWLNLPRTHLLRTGMPMECPECGWGPGSTNGVAVHRRIVHGVVPPKQRNEHATEATWVQTQDVRSRDRLLLSAPADTPAGLDISVREAAIVGWIAGDGHVENRRHRPTMSIAQSKPHLVDKLRRLLDDVPHALYIDDRGGCGPRHQFRLDHDYARDLLARAGNPKADAVAQVLAMSTAQRVAWLDAIIDAEGTRGPESESGNSQVAIYQAPGSVLEAITIAVYLSGQRPRVLHSRRRNRPESWQPEASVRPNTPVVTGAFLTKEDAGHADVWCVTTELGTWTAREDEHVFLTGNSNASAGHPSKGLMQCIDSTFNAHKLPGHDDIYNPVDNIIAGVRYTIGRYGSIANTPGLQAMSQGGGYVGY